VIDLTEYGEQELSRYVLNTEYLYLGFMRCEDARDLHALVDGEFKYTSEQFDELVSDLLTKDD